MSFPSFSLETKNVMELKKIKNYLKNKYVTAMSLKKHFIYFTKY